MTGEARLAQASEIVGRFSRRLREGLRLDAAAMWEDLASAVPADCVHDPKRRRLWLLGEAVKHVPLAQALVVARAAEILLAAHRRRVRFGEPQSGLDALIRRGTAVRRFRPPSAARLRDQ